MLEELKKEVLQANLDLVKYELVVLTWGNVSGIDREKNLVAIKPSGVEYENLTVDDIVIVDLEGKVVEGNKRPSSDTPTHVELYKTFKTINGITHTHSKYATMFAQACKEIQCLGTTHADHFYGSIPLTRFLTKEEVDEAYELNTGKIIAERFEKLNPAATPGVLVAGHAPFAFGKNAADSVRNALILERVAEMAIGTYQISNGINKSSQNSLPEYISEKHYQRKHGPNAYYGQKNYK
jgi:L-ribulose-5-phosphate 4-epimerase